MVIHSSPASPDPPGTDADENNIEKTLPKGRVTTSDLRRQPVAASTADRKGLKKMRAYFRALNDHGLPVEAILEHLRSKYPNVTSAAEDIPVILKVPFLQSVVWTSSCLGAFGKG